VEEDLAEVEADGADFHEAKLGKFDGITEFTKLTELGSGRQGNFNGIKVIRRIG
jgi:hypothetical protein